MKKFGYWLLVSILGSIVIAFAKEKMGVVVSGSALAEIVFYGLLQLQGATLVFVLLVTR